MLGSLNHLKKQLNYANLSTDVRNEGETGLVCPDSYIQTSKTNAKSLNYLEFFMSIENSNAAKDAVQKDTN